MKIFERLLNGFYRLMIVYMVMGVVHCIWQTAVIVVATVKWKWAGFGYSFLALTLFNLVEWAVFQIYNRITDRYHLKRKEVTE